MASTSGSRSLRQAEYIVVGTNSLLPRMVWFKKRSIFDSQEPDHRIPWASVSVHSEELVSQIYAPDSRDDDTKYC